MKKYRDLLRELPSKSVVVTYGRFNPPSTGHELLIKVVRKLAKQRKSDHIVFVSAHQDKKNPLEISKKIQYLEAMFPGTKFIAAKEDIDCIGSLNKYKNATVVTSSDSASAYRKLIKRGNFETVDVVEAMSKDPDSDDRATKLASKGNYTSFKKVLPTTVRDIDGKRLMNDIRIGLNLEPIKEQINLVKDDLREQYFRGEIFNEGDIVESDNTVYKIIKRGSNHLLLQTESGLKVSKWIQDVQLTEREFMLDEKQLQEAVSQTGGTSVDLEKAKADSEKARLVAKQADDKAKLVVTQKKEMDNLRNTLQKESNYNIAKSIMSLSDFRKSLKAKPEGESEEECEIADKVKDGLIGNTHLGDDSHLRHMKIKHHYKEETEEQKDTREAQLKRFKDQAKDAKLTEAQYAGLEKEDKPGKVKTAVVKTHPKAVSVDTVEGWKDEQKPVKEEFDDLDAIVTEAAIASIETELLNLSDDSDEFFEAYEDSELAIIDEDTGEEIEAVDSVTEEALMEVLSRVERIRAKARMRRSQTKRERREKVALRQLSTPQVANKRARRMAVSALKKRLLRGQNPAKISVGQKERVERFIQQRRKIVDRLAARMVSRVKQVEKARMSHKKFTKPNNGVAF